MAEKKYLDKMEWQPEVIYYVKAISRNPKFKPKVWENEGKFGPFYVTDVKVARYNTIDKKYTEVGLFQFRIAKSILNEVQHKVDVDMPFYLRKSAGFNKEGKPITKYNIYNTPEEITDIQQDMVSETYDVKPSPIKRIDKVDIPFDNDMGDDAVAFGDFRDADKIAFKEDIKTSEPDTTLDDILVTLQSIEKHIESLAVSFNKMLDKFTVKIKKVKE